MRCRIHFFLPSYSMILWYEKETLIWERRIGWTSNSANQCCSDFIFLLQLSLVPIHGSMKANRCRFAMPAEKHELMNDDTTTSLKHCKTFGGYTSKKMSSGRLIKWRRKAPERLCLSTSGFTGLVGIVVVVVFPGVPQKSANHLVCTTVSTLSINLFQTECMRFEHWNYQYPTGHCF